MEFWKGLDLLMKEVQGERLGRPVSRHVAFGRIGHEREHQERIEGRPYLARCCGILGN